MGGHIDCYLDVSSFYSYMAITYLLKNKDLLASHNVTIEKQTTLGRPRQSKIRNFDVLRTKKHYGLPDASAPPFFPPLTLLPQRALCYIKSQHPSAYLPVFLSFFEALWVKHINITLPEPLSQVLSSLNLFTTSEISSILAATKEQQWKDALTANTQKALDLGAFGAPWFWVKSEKGEEPFFGSDRWGYMFEFLGVPWRDVEILPVASTPKEKAKL